MSIEGRPLLKYMILRDTFSVKKKEHFTRANNLNMELKTSKFNFTKQTRPNSKTFFRSSFLCLSSKNKKLQLWIHLTRCRKLNHDVVFFLRLISLLCKCDLLKKTVKRSGSFRDRVKVQDVCCILKAF